MSGEQCRCSEQCLCSEQGLSSKQGLCSQHLRRRLAQIHAHVEAFEDFNWEQGHLKGLVLSIIRFAHHARWHGRELERWWRIVEEYQRALASPRLVGKGRQTYLRKVIG